MPAAVAPPSSLPFYVEFGRPATAPLAPDRGWGLELRLPHLAGDTHERLFADARPAGDSPGMALFSSGDLLLGFASEPITDERTLAVHAEDLYRRVLGAVRGQHLYRIWNYVPRINALTNGFENYRAFCQGRSLAFEAELGTGFAPVLPAASGVGTDDGCLSLVFVAGPVRPRHFENPAQIPAYRYPAEHGPRAPSFSRATVATVDGRTYTFISGTAAIKGHATVAGPLEAQLACTLDNLHLIGRAAGLAKGLGSGSSARRHFKVYLRHPGDLTATRAVLERSLLQPGDHVVYLQADICRAALNVEIEATICA